MMICDDYDDDGDNFDDETVASFVILVCCIHWIHICPTLAFTIQADW